MDKETVDSPPIRSSSQLELVLCWELGRLGWLRA